MKKAFALLMLIALLSMSAWAQSSAAEQTPANIYAAGLSYNTASSPEIAGTGLWAHKLADLGTYSFTVVDVLPTARKPFAVSTNMGTGLAQRVFSIGQVPIFASGSAGISVTGQNTGWAATMGALASVRVKSQYRVLIGARVVKSSVSNGSGYQPIASVLLGWGQ